MNIYNEIQHELMGTPFFAKEPIETLFKMCQKYYHLYQIDENTRTAQKTLQHYLDEEYLIAKRSTTERKRQKSLEMSSKLYIEFLWKIYNDSYRQKWGKLTEKNFFEKVIYAQDRKEKIVDLLQVDMNSSLFMCVNSSINNWVGNYDNCSRMEDLNLENLHNAMKSVKQKLDIVIPSIEESVEDLIEPQMLLEILHLLKEKNYPACTFLVAPITRALTVGAVTKYTRKEKNTTIYFTEKLLYNLEDLNKRIDGLKELLSEYSEIQEDLKKF